MPRSRNSPISTTGTSQTMRGSLLTNVPSRKNRTKAAQPASVAANITMPSTPTANARRGAAAGNRSADDTFAAPRRASAARFAQCSGWPSLTVAILIWR